MRTARGRVAGSQTAQREGPSHRPPALQTRGRGRRFSRREKASASSAAVIYGAPAVCSGLRGVLPQGHGYCVLPSSLS